MRDGDSPQVSVVIATFRRPIELDRCLSALLKQTCRKFDIVIADDSATDDGTRTMTAVQIDRWQQRFAADGIDIACIPVIDTQGPAAARNAGWRTARAPIIAFTDDDTIPSPSWLEQGLSHFRDPAVGAVSGRIVVPLRTRPTDYERNVAGLEHCPFVTANCWYRRSALEEVGGFDERFTMAWREDTDLWFAVLKRGYACTEVRDTIVEHPVRPASWGISIREQKKTLFNALLYKKHGDLCKAKNILPRSPRYYAIVVTAALAILGFAGVLPHGQPVRQVASTENSGIAFLSLNASIVWATLWAIFTGEFVLYRLHHTSRRLGHVLEMIVTSIVIPPLSLYWRIVGAIRFRVFYF